MERNDEDDVDVELGRISSDEEQEGVLEQEDENFRRQGGAATMSFSVTIFLRNASRIHGQSQTNEPIGNRALFVESRFSDLNTDMRDAGFFLSKGALDASYGVDLVSYAESSLVTV